ETHAFPTSNQSTRSSAGGTVLGVEPGPLAADTRPAETGISERVLRPRRGGCQGGHRARMTRRRASLGCLKRLAELAPQPELGQELLIRVIDFEIAESFSDGRSRDLFERVHGPRRAE